jgi:hypothetical protein
LKCDKICIIVVSKMYSPQNFDGHGWLAKLRSQPIRWFKFCHKKENLDYQDVTIKSQLLSWHSGFVYSKNIFKKIEIWYPYGPRWT